MYTNKSIRLHNKCLQVLEAMQTLHNRIESHVIALNSGLCTWLPSMARHYEERTVIDTAIVRRLERYYRRLLIQINDVLIKEDQKSLVNN